MIAAWGEDGQGLEAIRRVAADHREAATPVVVRACQDFLIRGHRAPLAWLRELRDSITDIEALMHLADAMPRATTELRETALEVEQAIAGAAAALVERDAGEAAKALRAKALNNLSVRLCDLGRREAALAAIEEAVSAGRWPQRAPTPSGPTLPFAEQPVGHLADLGRREAALAAIEEAVASLASWPRRAPTLSGPTSPVAEQPVEPPVRPGPARGGAGRDRGSGRGSTAPWPRRAPTPSGPTSPCR